MMSEASADTALGRPFPWFCPKCRRKEVRRTTIAYQCQRLRGGQPIVVAVPKLTVPRCGHCGEMVFDAEAEEQINRACRDQVAALTTDGAQQASVSQAVPPVPPAS